MRRHPSGPARTRILLTLALSYALLGILMNSVGTVILQSIRHFDIGKLDGSTLEACKDLSVVAASFLLAAQVPAFGYRRAQMLLLGVMAVACLLASFATHFRAMQLLFVVTGFSFGVAKIATYSVIGLLATDQDDHAGTTGFVEGMFMLGVLSGAWIFSWFIGDGADPHGWLRVYWLLAALCALAALGWAGLRLDEGEAASGGASPQAGWREMASLALLPATVAALAALFLYVLIEQGVGTWLPTFNNQMLGLPPALSVQMSSLFVASLAAGRLLSAVALKHVSWLPLLLGCLAGVAALVLLSLPLAQEAATVQAAGWADAPLAAWLFPMIGLLLAPLYPTICSVTLSALPKSRHAAMTALIVIFSALGGTLGSFLTAFAFQHMPGATAFYGILVPLAGIALLLPVIRRRQQRALAA